MSKESGTSCGALSLFGLGLLLLTRALCPQLLPR